jgi:hypothetical protein
MLDSQYLTNLQASTACYWDSFTLLYVDDVRTSQETQDFTACYWDSFTYFHFTQKKTLRGADTQVSHEEWAVVQSTALSAAGMRMRS